MDMRTPPLRIKIMLESSPLKSKILVLRLTVATRPGSVGCRRPGKHGRCHDAARHRIVQHSLIVYGTVWYDMVGHGIVQRST